MVVNGKFHVQAYRVYIAVSHTLSGREHGRGPVSVVECCTCWTRQSVEVEENGIYSPTITILQYLLFFNAHKYQLATTDSCNNFH